MGRKVSKKVEMCTKCRKNYHTQCFSLTCPCVICYSVANGIEVGKIDQDKISELVPKGE